MPPNVYSIIALDILKFHGERRIVGTKIDDRVVRILSG